MNEEFRKQHAKTVREIAERAEPIMRSESGWPRTEHGPAIAVPMEYLHVSEPGARHEFNSLGACVVLGIIWVELVVDDQIARSSIEATEDIDRVISHR